MKSRAFWFGLFSSVLAAACGPSPGATGATKEPEPSAGGASSTQPTDAPGQPAGQSLAEQRAGFIESCSKKMPGAPDYCQCSWDLLISVFDEADMKAEDADPKKMAEYKDKVGPTCGGKIPEEFAKKTFVAGCSSKSKKLTAYCECAWPELRKTLSVVDLTVADMASPARVNEAKQGMVKACGKKMPEEVPKEDFTNECLKSNPDAQKFCECAWKQLRTAHSPAEIAAGLADSHAVKPKIEASCAKLHPAHKPGAAK